MFFAFFKLYKWYQIPQKHHIYSACHNLNIFQELASSTATKQTKYEGKTDSTWSDTELQLLVKATTLFPVGTASRWEVIASYLNEHSDSKNKKTGKQVISKVKSLKKLGRVKL